MKINIFAKSFQSILISWWALHFFTYSFFPQWHHEKSTCIPIKFSKFCNFPRLRLLYKIKVLLLSLRAKNEAKVCNNFVVEFISFSMSIQTGLCRSEIYGRPDMIWCSRTAFLNLFLPQHPFWSRLSSPSLPTID